MSFTSGTLLYTRLWQCRLFLNRAVTAAKTEFNQSNNKDAIFKYFHFIFVFCNCIHFTPLTTSYIAN